MPTSNERKMLSGNEALKELIEYNCGREKLLENLVAVNRDLWRRLAVMCWLGKSVYHCEWGTGSNNS